MVMTVVRVILQTLEVTVEEVVVEQVLLVVRPLQKILVEMVELVKDLQYMTTVLIIIAVVEEEGVL